jgi:hypothetical protein
MLFLATFRTSGPESGQPVLYQRKPIPSLSPSLLKFALMGTFPISMASQLLADPLVNLESRRVVDLLADREAEASAAWMRKPLDLMVVSRDRGGAYASAAALGAPQATQCADRFQLLKNLGEALEDLLARHLSASRKRQVEAALKEQTPAWQETRQPRCSRTPEEGLSPYQQDRLARTGRKQHPSRTPVLCLWN